MQYLLKTRISIYIASLCFDITATWYFIFANQTDHVGEMPFVNTCLQFRYNLRRPARIANAEKFKKSKNSSKCGFTC